MSFEDCILIGTGSGKTTLTRYLINYLQKKEQSEISEVSSPTFNLLYEYDINKYKIMHYDLYRIKKKEELENLEIFSTQKKDIKIIEWPELVMKVPKDKLEIHIKYVKNKNHREIKFKGTGKWKNFKNEI